MRPETEQPAASAETFHIGTGVVRIQIQIFVFFRASSGVVSPLRSVQWFSGGGGGEGAGRLE